MHENRQWKMLRILICAVVAMMLTAGMALAQEAGWNQEDDRIWYCVTGEYGLERLQGFNRIGKKYYYFDEEGYLQTGWQNTDEGIRYFSRTGKVGRRGRMLTGIKTIAKKRYYFPPKSKRPGVVATGFTKVGDDFYYFNKKQKEPGLRGAAYTSCWITVGGEKHYFGSDGAMCREQWVNDTYYLDQNGLVLKNWITPDGYVVDREGRRSGEQIRVSGWVEIDGKTYYYHAKKKKVLTKKWLTIAGQKYYLLESGERACGTTKISSETYYFNRESGEMMTGPVRINGTFYLFADDGKLARNNKKGDYKTNRSGKITSDTSALNKKVLVLAGHGQGDPGACSGLGQEYLLTRQFARLLYEKLLADKKVTPTYLMDGSQDFDLFQRHKAILGSFRDSVWGTGRVRQQLIQILKNSTVLPNLNEYDYVVEIHFNASAPGGKDPGGNGVYKGFMIYVNKYKSFEQRQIDRNILSSILGLGYARCWDGIVASEELTNARVCQEAGTNYSLLETAFIDDADDMRFYVSNKEKMAAAIAQAIENSL